jgi:gluconate 5-dehydrogenase
MTARPFDLSGRLALVTGASMGLGLAIARGLARAGANVVVNARNVERIDAVIRLLAKEGFTAMPLPFDVTDEAAVDAAIAKLTREAGVPDILVNNAGAIVRKPLDAVSPAQWRELQAVNVDGPFFVTRALLPAMKVRRSGKIINICSLASDLGRPNIVAYATSKGAIRMFTRALAVELAPFGIQVNGIAPGFFATQMNESLVADAGFSAWVKQRTPAGRWGEPDEIAGAAVFLASAEASYVSGHILNVDGGFAAAY